MHFPIHLARLERNITTIGDQVEDLSRRHHDLRKVKIYELDLSAVL